MHIAMTLKKTKPSNNNKNKKTNPDDEDYSYDGVIVLGVNLHCEACVRTVLKALRGFNGVEEVEANQEENRVKMKGTACNPFRIAERVRHKLGKPVEIISPVDIKKKEKKKEAPKVTETVLKMRLHCEGCAKDVRRCVLKMEGVESVKPDMNASTVTIKGIVEPKDLIVCIYKKTGKKAEVVIPKNQKGQNQNQDDGVIPKNQKGQNQNQNDGVIPKNQKGQNQNQNDGVIPKNQKGQNQNQNDGVISKKQKGQNQNQNNGEEMDNKKKDERNIGLSYPNDPSGFVYATEILSDENPNACSIM